MAADINYPDIPFCSGTTLAETTTVDVENTESGNFQARVYFTSPTYNLRLVHTMINEAELTILNQFWIDSWNKIVGVNYRNSTYEGVITGAPITEHINYQRYNVSVELAVKRVA